MTRADTTYRDLETGRDAAARRAWPSAYDALSSADAARRSRTRRSRDPREGGLLDWPPGRVDRRPRTSLRRVHPTRGCRKGRIHRAHAPSGAHREGRGVARDRVAEASGRAPRGRARVRRPRVPRDRARSTRVERIGPTEIVRSGNCDADWAIQAGPELVTWLGRDEVKRSIELFHPSTRAFLEFGMRVGLNEYLAVRAGASPTRASGTSYWVRTPSSRHRRWPSRGGLPRVPSRRPRTCPHLRRPTTPTCRTSRGIRRSPSPPGVARTVCRSDSSSRAPASATGCCSTWRRRGNAPTPGRR